MTSINRAGSNPTNAASVSWFVAFDDSVNGVTASNFTPVAGGGLGGTPVITAVFPLGPAPASQWMVTVSAGTGSGTIGLNKTSNTGVTDFAGNAMVQGNVTGQVYTIDRVAPAAPSTPDLTAATDSGSSSTDNVTRLGTTYTGTTSESGLTIRLFTGSLQIGSAFVAGTSYTVSDQTGFNNDGGYGFKVQATDAAGNVSGFSGEIIVFLGTATLPPAGASAIRTGSSTRSPSRSR